MGTSDCYQPAQRATSTLRPRMAHSVSSSSSSSPGSASCRSASSSCRSASSKSNARLGVLAVPRLGLRPDGGAVRQLHLTGEPVLHPGSKPLAFGELRDLRPTRPRLGMPLRDRRLVVEPPCSRTPLTLRSEQRHVLAFGERQVSARHRRRKTGVHAASVTEPPIPDGG
jgi:hypothetical protein